MDCTTHLGMLRERRQRGKPCSPASGWCCAAAGRSGQPIHRAAGGADVVAACTTETEAEHVQQRKRTYSSATTSCNRDPGSNW